MLESIPNTNESNDTNAVDKALSTELLEACQGDLNINPIHTIDHKQISGWNQSIPKPVYVQDQRNIHPKFI